MVVPWARGVGVMLLFILVTARISGWALTAGLKPCPPKENDLWSYDRALRDAQVRLESLGRPVVWLLMRFGFPAASEWVERNAGPSTSLRFAQDDGLRPYELRWFALRAMDCALRDNPGSVREPGHARLWSEGMSRVGTVKCVGILRFAQNDGLWPLELRWRTLRSFGHCRSFA